MRSIINRKDDSKRNQLILGIFLIIIMLFSTLGYALLGRTDKTEKNKIEYNGIEFIQDNSGYWYSTIQGYEFITQYNPKEIEDIQFFGFSDINNYANKPLYFVGDLGEPSSEIIRNLANRFVLRIQEACLDEGCESDLPIKNCSKDNVIVINEVLENDVENMYQEGGCVFITAGFANQTRYADKFLFDLLGI